MPKSSIAGRKPSPFRRLRLAFAISDWRSRIPSVISRREEKSDDPKASHQGQAAGSHFRIMLAGLEMRYLARNDRKGHLERMSVCRCVGFLLSSASVASTGCVGTGPDTDLMRQDALDQLIAVELAFARFASDSTVQQAFTRFIAPDGILFRPGPVDGPAALEAQPMPEAVALLWEPAFADASAAGDLGYTTGPYRSGARGTSPDSLPGAGQYVTLWRRTPDGFRFVLDTGILHDPSSIELPASVERAGPVADAGTKGAVAPAAALDGLLIADQDLGEALAMGDPGVYRAYATDGVRVLRDGSAPAFGADALIAAAMPFAVTTAPADGGISASNDLGYTYGEVRRAENVESPLLGYYLRIWRRQADGSWKTVLDLVSVPPS